MPSASSENLFRGLKKTMILSRLLVRVGFNLISVIVSS